MNSLSKAQVELLFTKTLETLTGKVFEIPSTDEKETAFTERVILPFISSWVTTLNVNGLHVRGDGGPNPLAVIWDDISFYPDVTIMNFYERLISFEIKFLKFEDASGSLTKALGQTLMYEKAGFAYSIGIIVDCRKLKISQIGIQYSDRIVISEHSSVLIFKPLAN